MSGSAVTGPASRSIRSVAVPDPWKAWRLDDPTSIEAALEAHPLAAARLASRSKLPSAFVPFLDHRVVPLGDLFATLDPIGVRLLQLAKFHHGITRQVALAEATDVPAEVIDRSARNLFVAGLATSRDGVLTVAAEVEPYVELALPLFEDHVDTITSDRLALACRLLGVDGGTRKAERAAAVLAVLRDPDRVSSAIVSAGPAAARLFARIGELTTSGQVFSSPDAPPGAIPLREVVPPEDRHAAMGYGYGRRLADRSRRPHEELGDRLIVGTSPYGGYSLWLWFDVMYALTGRVFPSWTYTAPPAPQPLDDAPATAARAVTMISDLTGQLAVQPALGKKTGDLRPPVRAWRTAAKAVGADAASAPLFGDLAADIGLVYARALAKQGRGRSAEFPVQWQPNPARLAEFESRPMGERWLMVVDAWLKPGSYAMFVRTATLRHLTLAFLATFPEGTGLPRRQLDVVAEQRHLALGGTQDLDEILAEMVALGLAPVSGPIGLTSAGRAAARGAAEVDGLIAAGSTECVVQPDHSVIAPADLAPTVMSALHRYAELKSQGGASVWRLSAKRLGLASTTTTAEEVVAFFRQHSKVAVPDVVARFISDAMNSVSPVTVAEAGCIITAADPIVIAEAARHKTAKLTVLAPGVAVSPLTTAKVSEILRAKGVVLAGTSATADTGPSGPLGSGRSDRIIDEATWVAPQRDPNQPLGPARPITIAGPMAADLAGRLGSRRRSGGPDS